MTERPIPKKSRPEHLDEPSFSIISRGPNGDYATFNVIGLLDDPDAAAAGLQSNFVDVSRLNGNERAEVTAFAHTVVADGYDALNLYFLVEAKVKEMLKAKEPSESPMVEMIYRLERQRIKAFFGMDIDVPKLPTGVTEEKVIFWEMNRFRMRYLPSIDMTEDKEFPGWKHKPGKRHAPGQQFGIEFYDDIQMIEDLAENKHNPDIRGLTPTQLPGCWTLVDTRQKPEYRNGEQMYEQDEAIQKVLKQLVKDGVVNQEAEAGLRNMIRPHVFNKPEFWAAFHRLLQLEDIPGAVVRLPRVIEANVMGQGAGFHNTNTYEWCEEYHGPGKRLLSGSSGGGGASAVDRSVLWSNDVGFRALVVFSGQ